MRRALLAPLVVALSLAAPGCGDSTDTTYRWSERETRTYRRSTEITGTFPTGSSGTIVTAFTTKETALEVLPRSRSTVKVEFDRVELEIRRGGSDQVLRLDTKSPPGEKEKTAGGEVAAFFKRSAALAALSGRSFEIVQFPSGILERFDALDSLRESLLKDGPDDPYFKMGVDAVLSRGYLTDTFRPCIVMPASGMTPGEKLHFQDLHLLPDPVTGVKGLLYYKGTFHLAGVAEGVARVEMEADTSLDPFPNMPAWPEPLRENRKRLRLEKGTCRAWAKVRVETGVFEESEHVTDLDLRFVKPDGAEVPIPVKVTQRLQRIP